MKPRPWCACGKVRLGVKRAPVIVESGKRLAIHEATKCTVHRIEVAK